MSTPNPWAESYSLFPRVSGRWSLSLISGAGLASAKWMQGRRVGGGGE
jgi:hypothetical protein